jgi:hypothetical protein
LMGITFALLFAAIVPEALGGEGIVEFSLNGPAGEPVAMNITLQNLATGEEYTFASGTGHGLSDRLIPAGKYKAYIRALWQYVWYVVDIQDVEVLAGEVATVQSAFAEGAGRVGLPAFYTDFDGVIDRVVYEVGTDPRDATDIPGKRRLEIDTKALNKEEGWYRGELRSYSTYSGGKMSVRDIIQRAEKLGLDFVAITDRGSLESCTDADFKSDKVLLIPAYEWGVEGHATLLGARTLMRNWDYNAQVQAAIRLAHAQGVLFCINDPCSAASPWEWTVGGFHAMEVWSGKWRSEPQTKLGALGRGERTRPIDPSTEIKASLAVENVCRNSQALKFLDAILQQGVRITAVGGSGASDRLRDIGSPVTYVYARELSVPGILEAIFLGRTFVSSGPDGPKVLFMADIDEDGKFDAPLPGSVVPVRRTNEAGYQVSEGVTETGDKVIGSELVGISYEPIQFRVAIEGLRRGQNVKIKVIKNGNVFRIGTVDHDKPVYDFKDAPWKPGYYRIELYETVSDRRSGQGYGNTEMLALTGPIYADVILVPERKPAAPQEEERAPAR